MMPSNSIVFLVDVDDTLLENDRIQDDLKRQAYGGNYSYLRRSRPTCGRLAIRARRAFP
jgi:hypothetical protein